MSNNLECSIKDKSGFSKLIFFFVKTSLLADMHDLDIMTSFTNIASMNAENNGLKTISVVIMQE